MIKKIFSRKGAKEDAKIDFKPLCAFLCAFAGNSLTRNNYLRKKRTLGLSVCVTLIVSAFCIPVAHMNSQDNRPDYKNPRLPVERRVADLLSRMTLEEKVAQLTCLWGSRPQVNPQTDFSTDRGEFSPAKAAEVMKHGIGQIARQRERKGSTRGCDLCQRSSEMAA